MTARKLAEIAKSLLSGEKGILAMDESNPTCNKRFAPYGIPQTVDARRSYREMILTTPHLSQSISGVILSDETIRQQKRDGTSFLQTISDAGIVPGIKVDLGTSDLAAHPGERATKGLDGLRERLNEYAHMGARFAKWRSVFNQGSTTPTRGCIEANAQDLARYASLCQEAGLVPIVEPELLIANDSTLEACQETTQQVLHAVFRHLVEQGVMLECLLLKPNMVLPGQSCPKQRTVEEIAHATIQCMKRCVPAAVPGIVFLSGGQPPALASARLNAMNVKFSMPLPWEVGFSFARAIQQPALQIWMGDEANNTCAQNAIRFRASCNRAARRGEYTAAMENQ